MRHRIVLALLVLAAGAGYALAQKSPAERDSTRGRRYRAVLVTPVLSVATRFVDRDQHYAETKKLAEALEQLDREGYEPVSLSVIDADNVVVLAKQR